MRADHSVGLLYECDEAGSWLVGQLSNSYLSESKQGRGRQLPRFPWGRCRCARAGVAIGRNGTATPTQPDLEVVQNPSSAPEGFGVDVAAGGTIDV